MQDFWNGIELLMLALIFASVAMMGYRWYLLFETSRRRREMSKLDYISFHFIADFEEVSELVCTCFYFLPSHEQGWKFIIGIVICFQQYLFVISFVTFIATVKSLKLLRFNKNMNILGYTMLYVAEPLMSFLVAMITVFIAYSHMAYLVYNSLLLEFNSFLYSIFTLFTLMLSK